jgi:hypothetical protein
VHEFKVIALLGRQLYHFSPAGDAVELSIAAPVRFATADGRTDEIHVSLLFPGTARSVARCTDDWWQICKGGKPNSRSERITAAASGKADHRAMPVR